MAEFLRVGVTLSRLRLEDSMHAAEFGCGSGFFSLALAQLLWRGKVHSLDIQAQKIQRLKADAKHQGYGNLVVTQCDLEQGSPLRAKTMDIVVIPNLLFQTKNPYAILQEASRVLKKRGQLLVIDWRKKHPLKTNVLAIDPLEVKKKAQQIDFSLQREFHAGDYHFGLLFTKES